MAGLFVVNDRLAVGEAIRAVLLVDEGSEPADWSGRVMCLPL